MNYSTLTDRVSQYLDRSDLGTSASSPISSTKIGSWINDVRKDISLKYDFKYLYVEATCNTSAATATYALPADYLGHLVLWCGSKKLMRISPREFDELTKTDIDSTAIPRELPVEAGNEVSTDSIQGAPDYYIDRGMEFELYPVPNGTYVLKLKYYAQPADFTTGAEYDYISTFHAEAVIWGTCHRGAIFLDDDAGEKKYAELYDRAIKEMIKREKTAETEDQHVRWKTWADYDLTTFKRAFKVKI